MVVNEPRDLNIRENGSGNATQSGAPNPWGAGDKPKTIWTGMKKADAEQYNLLDEFNKANTTLDDTISEQEYNAFISQKDEPKDITSNSGKRVAVGGIYTVVKGDTLSKIAKDFNIDVFKLFNANKDIIGKNMDRLEVGMQLTIKNLSSVSNDKNTTGKSRTKTSTAKPSITSELESVISDDNIDLRTKARTFFMASQPSEKPKLIPGMTREQAKQKGVEDLFNETAGKNATVLSKEQYTTYLKSLISIDTDSVRSQLGEIIGKEKLNVEGVSAILDEMLQITYGDVDQRSQVFVNTQNKEHQILLETSNTLKEKKERGEKLTKDDIIQASQDAYSKFEVSLQNDLDKTNKDSAINRYLSEFEKNGLPEKLKLAGYDGLKWNDLTEEQKNQIATDCVRRDYVLGVVNMLKDAINSGDDEKIAPLIMHVSDEFIGKPEIVSMIQAMGMEGLVGEIKQMVTDYIASKRAKLSGNAVTDAVLTNVVTNNASTEAVQEYIENNSTSEENIDFLKHVTNGVLSTMQDGEKKDALRGAIETAFTNVQNGTSASSSKLDSDAGVSRVTNYASNPISSTYVNEVAALRESYETIYGDKIQQNEEIINKTRAKYEEIDILETIRKQSANTGIKIEELKNMPLAKAMSTLISHFNEMPEEIKTHFTNHLIQFANTHSDLACEAYILGDEQLKQFMNKHKIVTQDDVFKYFDEHEEQVKFAPKNLQIAYYKYASEEKTRV